MAGQYGLPQIEERPELFIGIYEIPCLLNLPTSFAQRMKHRVRPYATSMYTVDIVVAAAEQVAPNQGGHGFGARETHYQLNIFVESGTIWGRKRRVEEECLRSVK